MGDDRRGFIRADGRDMAVGQCTLSLERDAGEMDDIAGGRPYHALSLSVEPVGDAFPYLVITQREDFPRVFVTRNPAGVRPDGTTKPRSHASANAIEEPRRTFILTYFLPDNTLSIFEEHVNNSGVIGGAFLKRGKYKVPDEAGSGAMRYFSPTDFYLGALQGSKRERTSQLQRLLSRPVSTRFG